MFIIITLQMDDIIDNISEGHRPKLFVFDLDYTLWPFWVDTHVEPPFSKDHNGAVRDKNNYPIKLYPDVRIILEKLKSSGCPIAVASRTEAPSEAKDLLKKMNLDHYFTYKEIYPGKKIAHFGNFREASKVAYEDMIFFDDEYRNIRDIQALGVTCIHVPNGVNIRSFSEGLQKHSHFKKQNKKKQTSINDFFA